MYDVIVAERLFFTQLFVPERKQIAFMADEKLPTRISHHIFATSRSEKRINMMNESITIKELYSLDRTIAASVFDGCPDKCTRPIY